MLLFVFQVRMNFGPNFRCPPQGLKDCRPVSILKNFTII